MTVFFSIWWSWPFMTNIKHKIKNPETKIKLDFYHLPAHCAQGSAAPCTISTCRLHVPGCIWLPDTYAQPPLDYVVARPWSNVVPVCPAPGSTDSLSMTTGTSHNTSEPNFVINKAISLEQVPKVLVFKFWLFENFDYFENFELCFFS